MKTQPFPYFVLDDVLPAETIAAMHKFWPSRDTFRAEIAHNYICDVEGLPGLFWREFMRNEVQALVQTSNRMFAPWIQARYGQATIRPVKVNLMESDPEYAGHGTHTHHYHDPCWAGTLLLYLDEQSGYPGTTISRHVSGIRSEQAKAAANTLFWYCDPNIKEVETVEYKSNRLFAMWDSPISYHSVKAVSGPVVGNRRIFRMHLKASDSWYKPLYGVTQAEYRAKRLLPSTDPQVLAWMEWDIAQLTA